MCERLRAWSALVGLCSGSGCALPVCPAAVRPSQAVPGVAVPLGLSARSVLPGVEILQAVRRPSRREGHPGVFFGRVEKGLVTPPFRFLRIF